MSKLIDLAVQLSSARRLAKDEKGAALIEYTVLLGIMLVTVIGFIGVVGVWINGKWSAFSAALP